MNQWWTPRLAGPVIAAAVLRFAVLAVSLARTGVFSLVRADTSSYLIPGRNLLLHGSFIADGVPDLVRTPGYSILLAITSLAGVTAASVANVILSVISVIVVWKLALAVFNSPRIAIGAAWIFAFEPLSVALSILLMSETLFLTCLLLCIERLVAFLHGRRLHMLAIAGLWLAAATFVRPVTYYLPICLALGLMVVLARVPGLRWKAPAVLLLGVLPWLGLWQVRNWTETGYSGFSSIADVNLYFLESADVIARVEHRPSEDIRNKLGYVEFNNHGGQAYLSEQYLAMHPEQSGWNQAQRLAFMHSEAVRVIHEHLAVYLRGCLISLTKTALNPGVGWFESQQKSQTEHQGHFLKIGESPLEGWIALVALHPWEAAGKAIFEVILIALYLLAALGIYRSDRRNACIWLLLGISLYFLAVSGIGGGPGVDARFRLPIMPIVGIFAAAGVLHAKSLAQLKCAEEFLIRSSADVNGENQVP